MISVLIGLSVILSICLAALYFKKYPYAPKKEPVYEWIDLPKTDLREIELSTYIITVTQTGGVITEFDWTETSHERRYDSSESSKSYRTYFYGIGEFIASGVYKHSPGVVFLANIMKIEYVKKSSVKAESYTRKSIRIQKDV